MGGWRGGRVGKGIEVRKEGWGEPEGSELETIVSEIKKKD